MSDLYDRIETLCSDRKVTVTTMCRQSGASRASLSDLKAGRKQNLSAETLRKIAAYFGVSVDSLLGNKDSVSGEGPGHTVSDEDIKFALFGGDGVITDAMYEEVRSFAAYVKRREEEKQRKD